MQENWGKYIEEDRGFSPRYRIMYWNHKSLGGWYYVHDQESGDPIECRTPEEVQEELKKIINETKPTISPGDLKIVREYPFSFNIEMGEY